MPATLKVQGMHRLMALVHPFTIGWLVNRDAPKVNNLERLKAQPLSQLQ